MEVQDVSASDKGQGRTAARADAARVPKPIGAGPEMKALGRFYRDVTWKGTINEGGMGPGTPAMYGVGRGNARVIQDGRWIAMDSEQDQFLEDGTFVLKWQLHWVSGWVPEHGEYRAVMADNYGHADVYRGHIDGDRLIFESMEAAGTGFALPGMPQTRALSTGETKCRRVTDHGSSSRNIRWCRCSRGRRHHALGDCCSRAAGGRGDLGSSCCWHGDPDVAVDGGHRQLDHRDHELGRLPEADGRHGRGHFRTVPAAVGC